MSHFSGRVLKYMKKVVIIKLLIYHLILNIARTKKTCFDIFVQPFSSKWFWNMTKNVSVLTLSIPAHRSTNLIPILWVSQLKLKLKVSGTFFMCQSNKANEIFNLMLKEAIIFSIFMQQEFLHCWKKYEFNGYGNCLWVWTKVWVPVRESLNWVVKKITLSKMKTIDPSPKKVFLMCQLPKTLK